MKKADSIRLAGIVRESIVDGPGIRFTIFCQGCPHACEGCHNPETHDFAGGSDCHIDRLLEEINKNPLLAGVTFSGGEPFCQPEAFLQLGRMIKEKGLNITVFSGYTLEQLNDMGVQRPAVKELLDITDILIDGPYVKEERDLTLQFRGSRNQRVIDMNETRKSGEVAIWKG
ncbi:MAG: anaerobic ribonucleoside-triphosphate reductase activating protein [Bacillota bacterium]|nr:anaerobic ribonucleoside-triphosphate reductase activating protein [Bacillota bacterium]